jgi:hypothetical protein
LLPPVFGTFHKEIFVRKTIRRGVLVTATAACALSFGLFQASAATVPALPALPELPLTSLTNLGQGVALAPTMPTLPAVPGDESRSLPTDGLPLAGLLSPLSSLLGGVSGVGVPQRADLPGDLAPGLSGVVSRLPLTTLSQDGVVITPTSGNESRSLPGADLAGLDGLTSKLPLGDMTSVADLSHVGQGVSVSPTLPAVPGDESRALPTDGLPLAGLLSPLSSLLGGVSGVGVPQRADLPAGDVAPELGELTSMLSTSETTEALGAPQLGDVNGVTDFAGVPTELPTSDLPTSDLGLPATAPGELPVGLDTAELPKLPKLPADANLVNEITKAPVVDLPQTDRLPVVAQVDHNGIVQKLVPNTDGVDVQGLPKPEVPDVASAPNAVKLPATTPQTPGMQSIGLPQELPVASAVDVPQAPSIHDVTGDLAVPAQLPQLPAV